MKSFSVFSIFNIKHAKKHCGFYFAFSLIEMLMALLVASILMVAVAPVMTKKFNDTVNFEGKVPNPYKTRVVYLTEPGEGEFILPNGIRQYTVTTVGAGGGGGAGSNYGCVVFTTESGSYLGNDDKYCEIRRGNGDMNFTIPDGINEIYVSMISGAGGGAGGSGKEVGKSWNAGTYEWTVPDILKGDRIAIGMEGAGGGGGGSDQGGGGGGASGAHLDNAIYEVAANKTKISIVVGAGGKGGYYTYSPGKGGAGWKNGEDGVANTGGGGGGGSTSFDDGAVTAYGGGGGAGQCITTYGWAQSSSLSGATDLWKTVFNYGGTGRNGGTCGPVTYNGVKYGGPSGGNGGADGSGIKGIAGGCKGQDGTVGDGTAFGDARGGKGGTAGCGGSTAGQGGHGQDYGARMNADYDNPTVAGGGAGGGGGGSGWAVGSNAPTGCRGPFGNGNKVVISKAGVGAGGAGGSCGWSYGGAMTGGEGGDGTVVIKYLDQLYGGTGGQAGRVVPRSRIGLTNTMNAGKNLTITLGKGGKGGDRVVIANRGADSVRTKNSSGVINSTDTTLADANGQQGGASTVMFGTTTLATTGVGSFGGKYQTTTPYAFTDYIAGTNCGTRKMDGTCATSQGSTWHGHQSGACSSTNSPAGTTTAGGVSTMLYWDGTGICGPAGGTIGTGSEFSKRNGKDGTPGSGGSGAYYGGFGGKGGDGYVKIEWGIPRNIDRTDAIRYSGGGGSAGETVTKTINISPVINKIKYKIGEGGEGATFNSANNTMSDGYNGGETIFGIGNNLGFETIKSKGGEGGKSAIITSTYDSNFMITALTGSHGAESITQCYIESNCKANMNGAKGENNKGGKGGSSSTSLGAEGASTTDGTNINGYDAINFNGTTGGGAGGGGGISANGRYGKGGKGANGYIKIEYLE